jgi:CDP-diacylglycerol--glycerol-3-phosphate 3-phosphatidyltransferase
MLDGKIARARNLVTNFGKFLDPLADKMLTTAAFIGFLAKGFGVGIVWVLFIVLFREFMISSLRLVVVSSDKSKVIAANIYGKLKTVTQMAAIIFGLLVLSLNNEIVPAIQGTMVESVLYIVFNVLLWASAVAAVISGIIYMKDSFEFIDPTK